MVKNQKGVTLVELLIVIVILGIIAAISVPAVGNIVSNAEKDAVLSDATNLQQQVNLYCTSENDPTICDVTEGTAQTTVFFEDDPEGTTVGHTLDEYISDIDGDYIVWWSGSVWMVALDTGDGGYYFSGDPQSDLATREDVLDSDGTEITDSSNPTTITITTGQSPTS